MSTIVEPELRLYDIRDSDSLDPITYEILRHRLWEINAEQATTITKVSPSPVATEAQDFNVMLGSAAGDVCYVGPFVQFHAVIMDLLIKRTLDTRGKDTGINPGDQFLTNDPYLGAAHYNDVAVLAPYFHDGELLLWTGSMLHNIDVGGVNVGSFCIDAEDMYGEPLGFPPSKIVEGGTMRGDLEELYLRQSRAPQILALDLRAQIAANHVALSRIDEVVERYGPDAVAITLQRTLEETEAGLRKRLKKLPDGQWKAREFVDKAKVGDTQIYQAQCTLTKVGDKLTFDVRESDPQVGHINLTYGGLRAGLMFPIIQILGWDLPWASSAMLKCVEIKSTPGTITDAQPPACVSAATATAMFYVMNLAQQCVCAMLASTEEWEREIAALDTASWTLMVFHGLNQHGTPFQAMLMDPMAGAVGARSWKDGVDTGGIIHTPSARMVDVEINELLSPILYLFRREAADSGGPGRFRGGSGGEICIVPHKTERLDCQTVAHGVTFPNNVGFAGGMPGSPIEYRLIRGSNVRELIAGGELPQEATPEKIGGELEWLPFRGHFTQLADDVFNVRFTTSGGFGDPLDRDPAAVVADVRNAYVSPEVAKATYGVVVGGDGALDADATEQRRAEIAKRRLEGGTAPAERGAKLGDGAERTGQVNQTIGIYRENGRVVTACERCHTTLAPADGNYKQGCHEQVTPVTELPYMPDPARYGMDEYLNLRWYHCPECARQLAVELAREGDGLFQDVVLTGSARGE